MPGHIHAGTRAGQRRCFRDRHTTRACDHARAGQRPWSSRSPGSFAMHFCSCFVLTHGVHRPCTARVRASSRGVWLAEQAWRPRPCVANRRSGSPRGHRPPLLRRAALSWLGRGRERGWRKPSGTWESVGPSVLAPEARSRGGRRHPWSAGKRACRKARGAFAKVPLVAERLTGAPHPHACEGKEVKGNAGAAPRLSFEGADGACLQFHQRVEEHFENQICNERTLAPRVIPPRQKWLSHIDGGPCRESPLPRAGEGGERMRAGRGLLFSKCLSPSPPSRSLRVPPPLAAPPSGAIATRGAGAATKSARAGRSLRSPARAGARGPNRSTEQKATL